MPNSRWSVFLAVPLLLLVACDGPDITHEYPQKDPITGRFYLPSERNAPDNTGISLLDFGGGGESGENLIGVNRHLWNASLDILSTLPLDQVDPYGGVITTEWHIDSATPAERTRVVARISGVELEARALKVHVYRQTRSRAGDWIAADVGEETIGSITDSILTRARQERIAEADATS